MLLTQLSAHRPLLVLDNAGIGASTGQVPPSFAGWADHVLELLVALKLELVDVLGFSMGGCVAQLVALRAPRAGVRVRRLVLAGTTASAGPGIKLLTSEEELAPFMRLRGAESEDEQRAAFLECFFLPGEEGRREGEKVWERVCRGREAGRGDGLAEYAGQEAAKRQAVAYARFMDLRRRGEGSFDRLAELTMPVLVANGMAIPIHTQTSPPLTFAHQAATTCSFRRTTATSSGRICKIRGRSCTCSRRRAMAFCISMRSALRGW